MLVCNSKLFFNYVLVRLREFGPCFDAEAARVIERFVHAFVGDLAVQQFADAWGAGQVRSQPREGFTVLVSASASSAP
jgi:hypothetical protein